MMDRPYIQLTRAQWKNFHNALCDAERQAGELFDVLKDGGKGLASIRRLREAMAPAYAQDNQTFDHQWAYFAGVQGTYDLASKWSLYDEVGVGEMELPHPYAGAQYVVYDNHWGDKEIVRKIAGPTWLDLWQAADKAIRASGDDHHTFIESFTPITDKPGHLRLGTGS